MVTWSDVLLWRAAHIETVQDDASAARKAAREQVQELEAHYSRIASQGLAIDAMRQALSRVQDELDHAVNAISAYMLACAEAIDGVRVVEAKVRSALEISEEIGCTIYDDGSVSIPYIDLSDAARYGKADVLLGKSNELHMCIADALSIARKVDEELRRKLQELAEDRFEQNGPKEGRHSASPGLPDDADESWSPSEVSAWWGALTDEERQACIERDPLKYGNLDGIDMASRDKANRMALYGYDTGGNASIRLGSTGLLQQAQDKFDQAQAAYDDCVGAHGLFSDEAMALKADRDRAGRDLADLQKIDERLRNGAGKDGEPVSLLALDTSGEQVKAAVAVGDVDHAQHVANFTPGMGTNVRDSLDNYVDVADRMRDNTEVVAEGIKKKDVAVVAWLDYDAPTDVAKTFDPSVASTDKAHAGAGRLAGFLTGVRSWRDEQGGSLHLTSVSHSYGSTTAGLAMLQVGEGVVDDHIYLASPGSGADSVGALGVDPSHVWVSAVPEGDAVQGMGPDITFGRNPEQVEGIQHLSGDATGAQGYDPQPSWPVANHSSYFAPPKPGERNKVFDDICSVVVGVK